MKAGGPAAPTDTLDRRGRLQRLAASRRVHVVVVAVLALAVNAAAWWRWRPEPLVHDEFSYLLAADTFVHGRLTNPTHPMWPHFETFHVIHRPSYQSKYPPGQGLALAAGRIIGGHPIAGVWLSFTLACAAFTWMLQGWLARRWALLGGVVAATHPFIGGWWALTYWGGAMAMAGGALVYGAVPRLWRRLSAPPARCLALGLALLILSRPLEGAVSSLPALGLLGWRVARSGAWAEGLRVVGLPLLVILGATAGWLAYYNWRVTGEPLRTPYQVWLATYQGQEAAGLHPDLRRYRGSPALAARQKLQRLASFYVPFPLFVYLAGLPASWRSRWTLLLLASVALVIGTSVAISPAWPHYTAPVAPAVLALLVLGLWGLWRWCRRLRWLRPLLLLPPLVLLAAVHRYSTSPMWFHAQPLGKKGLTRVLEDSGGQHLVVVRYGPRHQVNREWVYNEADIDAAPVVWARELGGGQDHTLFRYFQDRRIWLWEPDADPPTLRPHPALQRR